jgi:hypothetical protein
MKVVHYGIIDWATQVNVRMLKLVVNTGSGESVDLAEAREICVRIQEQARLDPDKYQ